MGQIKISNYTLLILSYIELTVACNMAGLVRSVVRFRNLNTLRSLSTSALCHNAEQAPIKVFGVEGRYAHALFSAASKTGALESTEVELNKVQSLLDEEPALAEYCFDPSVNKLAKRDVLVEVLKMKEFSELTINFMNVVGEENRLKRSKGIISAFNKIMKARRGEIDCLVTPAKPLDSEMDAKLTATLQKFVKPTETLNIESVTDPSLVGGMVINLGEYFIDMSTATKVKRIANALKGVN